MDITQYAAQKAAERSRLSKVYRWRTKRRGTGLLTRPGKPIRPDDGFTAGTRSALALRAKALLVSFDDDHSAIQGTFRIDPGQRRVFTSADRGQPTGINPEITR